MEILCNQCVFCLTFTWTLCLITQVIVYNRSFRLSTGCNCYIQGHRLAANWNLICIDIIPTHPKSPCARSKVSPSIQEHKWVSLPPPVVVSAFLSCQTKQSLEPGHVLPCTSRTSAFLLLLPSPPSLHPTDTPSSSTFPNVSEFSGSTLFRHDFSSSSSWTRKWPVMITDNCQGTNGLELCPNNNPPNCIFCDHWSVRTQKSRLVPSALTPTEFRTVHPLIIYRREN